MSNQNRYRLYLQMDSHLRTLQKKRTANFREDETKLLIQLWGSPTIQNKLFLTHRKAPVMRLLAANMQQRGFYRTPDEIKTRIRNLKCLYHRIKRSMACGTGIGTVDPDWPHFKAMDEILSKEYPRKETDRLMEEALEGPKVEDIQIKQEIDDIDIDDNDSWATNESVNSEYEEDTPPPPLKPAPCVTQNNAPPKKIQFNSQIQQSTPQSQSQSQQKKLPTILPAFSLPATQIGNQNPQNKSSIPFPLLILNSLQPQNDKGQNGQQPNNNNTNIHRKKEDDFSNILRDLVDVQKESLDVQKQKLEVEKQRLEFDRLIGTQMVTLVPMLGGLLQRLAYPSGSQELLDFKLDPEVGGKRKRKEKTDVDMLKDCKILRNMLEQGIKKYMMLDEEKDSDNDDSGIHNDEQSNCSEK